MGRRVNTLSDDSGPQLSHTYGLDGGQSNPIHPYFLQCLQEVPVKKFSNATSAAAQHPRAMARLVLAFVASLLVVLLALMGMSSGPNGAAVFAQATESPTPTPTPADTGPSGPAIALHNPSPAYNPNLEPTGELPDPPQISDKFDGVDRAYHIVARTNAAPPNSIIEAYWQPSVGLETTIGILTQVANRPDTWELFWDIPDTMSEGSGELIVRLFQQTAIGFEQIAEDKVEAELRHKGSYSNDPQPAEETVEITWPAQNGELGFYKPKGGFWRGVVEGLASGPELVGARNAGGAQRIFVFYSTTPAGVDPKFTACGNVNPLAARPDGSVPWSVGCTLAGKTLPSEVTSIAAVAAEVDQATGRGLLTQESADVHVIRPYAQTVERMTVSLQGIRSGGTAAYPTSQRRVAGSGCLLFEAIVKDHLGRPVQGANLDVHIQGPNDQVGFGSDLRTSSQSDDSEIKDPDKGSHEKEANRYCFDGTAGQEMEGDHNVPGGADIKHIESVPGTGLDSTSSAATAYRYGPGVFRFIVFSFVAGFTDITTWIDDEPIANEAATREADDDVQDPVEPLATARAQWLPAPLSISFSPRADSAPVGTCNKYTVRARSGNTVVPGINVDVHAQGPNNDLDFCDPGDGSPRRAPDQPTGDTAHQVEDEGESSHKSTSPDSPQIQHTEGETDENGNFIIGITSTATGSTQLTAWADGEKDQDNDVQGSSEASGAASKSWAASAADAQVRFVNPSAYGGSGDTISKKRDADERFHIVARVDLPDVVPGVEFFLGSGATFTKIGDGVRVGTSDTWELFWDVNVPDASYTLRAQITGTDKREDRAVTINNTRETAEMTRPLNATGAAFDKGSTTVEGVASAGANGVDLYYTKTDARETRDSAAWIRCGSVVLTKPGGTQNFSGKCDLAAADAAIDVTGIATVAYVCDPTSGCQTAEGREVGKTRHSGDAHRVFGFEANPVVSIEPAEAAGQTTTCKRFELSLVDGSGRRIPDANVDIHLTGPTDTAEFCDLADGTPRRAPDRGGHSGSPNQSDEGIHVEDGSDTHHTEGETNAGGKFVFGITSGTSGDSQLLAWADQDDNDELDANEKSDTAVMHWGGGGGTSKCTIKGNSRDNVLRGTPGADVICGGGGDDVIRARGGKDKVYGGGGNDILRGNSGGDLIKGGPGADRLNGGRGRDRCRPGRGRDSRVNCES